MKSTEFLQENYDMPGISAERLIEVIGRRIELQCPELVTRYGHDVVYDAIEHVAEFHAGASDVSAMVHQVRRDLESRSKSMLESENNDPYTKGWRSGMMGPYKSWSCPYPSGSKEEGAWESGYRAGLEEYQSNKNGPRGEVDEDTNIQYGVFRKGGSIGQKNNKPVKVFDDKGEAISYAKRCRASLSQGERGYYGMGYVVKAIKPEQGVSESTLNEFDPQGFGERYTLYLGTEANQKFETFADLDEAIDYVTQMFRDDPRTRHHLWTIRDINNETVWEHNPHDVPRPGKFMVRGANGEFRNVGSLGPQGVSEDFQHGQDNDPFDLSSDYALYIADLGRHVLWDLNNLLKKEQARGRLNDIRNWVAQGHSWGDMILDNSNYTLEDISAFADVLDDYSGIFFHDMPELWPDEWEYYVDGWKRYCNDVVMARQPAAGQTVHEDDMKSSRLMPTDDKGVIPPKERVRDANGNIVRKRIDNLKNSYAVMGLTGKSKQGVSENAEDERLYKKYAKHIGRDEIETAQNLVDKSGKFYPNVDRLAAILHKVHNSKKKQGVADESMMAGGMEAFSTESIERKYQELLGETTSAGSVATVMSGGANAGSLFGGSYTNPDNPFAKMAKKTKKTKIIKR